MLGKPTELVYIEWIDSNCVTTEWVGVEDMPPLEVYRVYTVGHVLDENETVIRVAGSYAETESGDSKQFSGIITIPKRAIRHRYTVLASGVVT